MVFLRSQLRGLFLGDRRVHLALDGLLIPLGLPVKCDHRPGLVIDIRPLRLELLPAPLVVRNLSLMIIQASSQGPHVGRPLLLPPFSTFCPDTITLSSELVPSRPKGLRLMKFSEA